MQIRIEGTDLPGSSCGPGPDAPDGHRGIHVAVQRRGRPDDLLGLVSGGAAAATWILPCEVISSSAGIDFRGPYIQGRPGGASSICRGAEWIALVRSPCSGGRN
jgi:hypothetical protein